MSSPHTANKNIKELLFTWRVENMWGEQPLPQVPEDTTSSGDSNVEVCTA